MVDGGTIKIDGERIRLHGIAAPEIRQLCRLEGDPWECGKRAASALADKVRDQLVTCEEKDRDRYGRMVARCLVNGEDLSEWLTLNGWAVAYVYYSYEYTRAETLAKAGLRGIWAGEFVLPWECRRSRR